MNSPVVQLERRASQLLRGFIVANKGICRKIERYLPQAKFDLFTLYAKAVADFTNSRPQRILVDVGGGKSCPFAKELGANGRPSVIAVDASVDELALNRGADWRVVADVVRGLPLRTGSADLVVSRTVLEHLENLDCFMRQAADILVKDGYFIHLFTSKYAPFSVLNQLLPNKVTKSLMNFFHPDRVGISAFPAFYDRCYYSAVKKLLDKYGFRLIDVQTNFYQSSYYDFFVPLFLVSVFYDLIVSNLGIKNLTGSVLFVAQRK